MSKFLKCILLLLLVQLILIAAGCNQNNGEDVNSMGTGKNENEFMSIPIVGGGYVTGLFAHPGEENLFYARTDVGGAYRWDNDNNKWIPILDMFGSDKHEYYDVASLALDPNDTDIVYVAVGRGKKYNILRSTDRGNSWTETNPPSSVVILGNANYRWCGERLAVDPNKGNIIYYGSSSAGLWKNTDPTKEDNWVHIPHSQVPLQSGSPQVGITFVAFDKNGGTDETGATKIIYAGIFGDGETDGIYRSTDAGETWELIPNSPKNPQRGIVASDGTLYVAHRTGVAKCPRNGSFIDISKGLRRGAYCGIVVEPNDPNTVLVAQQNMNSNNLLYRSTDGGENWERINCIRGTSPEWWPAWFWFARTSSIMMNPFNTKQIWYCDWYGIWRTEDVTAEGGAVFNAYNDNHEELCIATVCSPTSGETRLFSGIHDCTGFRHVSLTEIPKQTLRDGSSEYNEITSYAVFEPDSNIVYRVNQNHDNITGTGYKSTDNGKTWKQFSPGLPKDHAGGKIAVSCEDPDVLVWTPVNKKALYSTDGGSTWTPCKGISFNVVTTVWDSARVQLAANRKGRTIFYIFRSEFGFYRSMDNGKTFEHLKGNGLPTAYANSFSVKAVPKQDGGVWVNIEGQGLFKSDDAGETFTKLENVKDAKAFAFGKEKPGSKYPAAVYLFGKLTTDTQPENRLYMSDDMGKTWRRINDDNHKAGKLVCMDGDGQVYGKVFFGTSGRSIYYYGPGE